MKNCIRLFCINVLCFAALAAEEAVQLTTKLQMKSRWEVEGKPVLVQVKQEQKADLLFTEQKNWKFPIELTFILRDASIEVQGGEKHLSQNLKNPGPVLSLTEMSQFAGRPFKVSLLEGKPAFRFEDDLGKRYKDLSSFDDPFFEALFIQILHELFEIVQKNLKAGEGFEIVTENAGKVTFTSKMTFTVSENNADKMTLQSAFNIERQKVALPGKNENTIPAVIYGQLKGVWTIQKQNPLLFTFQDKGKISYAIGYEETQASIVHEIERSASTTPLP